MKSRYMDFHLFWVTVGYGECNTPPPPPISIIHSDNYIKHVHMRDIRSKNNMYTYIIITHLHVCHIIIRSYKPCSRCDMTWWSGFMRILLQTNPNYTQNSMPHPSQTFFRKVIFLWYFKITISYYHPSTQWSYINKKDNWYWSYFNADWFTKIRYFKLSIHWTMFCFALLV